MSSIRHYSKLNEIPNLSFEGYVWMSDKKNPVMLKNEAYDFGTIGTNPFIIEALLFNKKKNISIHIQHTGCYHITQYTLSELMLDGAVSEEKNYLPHRLSGVENVSFKQVWLPDIDELCEGMEVLTLKAIVFCGFNKKGDNHE